MGHNMAEGVQPQIALAQLFVAVLMAAGRIHAVVEMQGAKPVKTNDAVKFLENTL